MQTLVSVQLNEGLKEPAARQATLNTVNWKLGDENVHLGVN